MTLDRILGLEHSAHGMTRSRAVIDRDHRLIAARAVIPAGTAININSQHSPTPFPGKLDIDQFKPERLDRRLQQAHQGVTHSAPFANDASPEARHQK